MDFRKITCTEVSNKEDYYDLTIKTYNQEFTGRFERSEIRHLIQILDNSITAEIKSKPKDLHN